MKILKLTISSTIGLAVLVALPWLVTKFVVFQAAMVLIYAIAICAQTLLTQQGGQFSLGQGAFFAVGAYWLAISHTFLQIGYLPGILSTLVIGYIFGYVFSYFIVRLSGLYLALTTFALAVAAPSFAKLEILSKWTGGNDGLYLTEMPEFLGLSHDVLAYYLSAACWLTVCAALTVYFSSVWGKRILATRDHLVGASAMGVDVHKYKRHSFGLSSALTAMAGGLCALAVRYVAPDTFSLNLSMLIFLGMVICGARPWYFSLVGGAFMIFVPNLSEEISKGLSGVIFAASIFVVLFWANRAPRATFMPPQRRKAK